MVAVSASLTNDSNLSHFDFQITHLFSTTVVNSSHIIVQTECTFSWKSNKMGIFKEDFSFLLPVLHITFKILLSKKLNTKLYHCLKKKMEIS